MTDSRQVKFDLASCGVIASKPDLKDVTVYQIPHTPENDKIIKLFSVLLHTPKIAIYNNYDYLKTPKPSVLMFFKKTINTAGKREAELVDLEQGEYADRLWNIIIGKG